MKVLFINTLYPPGPGTSGGAEKSIQALAEGLKNSGIQVAVLTTTDQPGLHQDLVSGVRVWRAGLRNIYWHVRSDTPPVYKRQIWHALDIYNPMMKGYVDQVAAIERPDVASCHNLPGWSISAWSALSARQIPIAQVLHDHYFLCPNSTMFRNGQNCEQRCLHCRSLRVLHRPLSSRVSGVVGVSQFILQKHLSMGYFTGVPVKQVVHDARSPENLGVAPADLSPEPRQRRLRFGFIGKLAPNKGIEWLLQAFSTYHGLNAELWVAGSGPAGYRASLERRFASDIIRFLGQSQPSDFYPAVDVVVVPSLAHESLGMVVAEAFAFGRPVIGTRRGGIPEMVEEGVNGLLVEPTQPGELELALSRLATDNALRTRMGVAARASARPFLDMDRFLDDYKGVYRAVIDTFAGDSSIGGGATSQ